MNGREDHCDEQRPTEQGKQRGDRGVLTLPVLLACFSSRIDTSMLRKLRDRKRVRRAEVKTGGEIERMFGCDGIFETPRTRKGRGLTPCLPVIGFDIGHCPCPCLESLSLAAPDFSFVWASTTGAKTESMRRVLLIRCIVSRSSWSSDEYYSEQVERGSQEPKLLN